MCSRDCKKLGLASLAAVVLANVSGYIIHEVILGPVYRRPHYMSLWNPKDVMDSRMGWSILATVVFALLFTVVYDRGYEEGKPPLGQGLRYGLVMGLLLNVPHSLMSYMVYPVSCKLAGAWAAFGTLETVLAGIAVAMIYRPSGSHSH